jgi:hypothetical protein
MKPAVIFRRRHEIQEKWSPSERRLRAAIGRLRTNQLLALVADAEINDSPSEPLPWRRTPQQFATR